MTMTVKELKEITEAYPDSAQCWIVVDNKMGGVDEILSVEQEVDYQDERDDGEGFFLFATS
jgi:hypothetical protein